MMTQYWVKIGRKGALAPKAPFPLDPPLYYIPLDNSVVITPCTTASIIITSN